MSEKRRDNRNRILHKRFRKQMEKQIEQDMFNQVALHWEKLHLNLHLLPAKICNNMPIFAKIRIYRLVEKPNKIKGL